MGLHSSAGVYRVSNGLILKLVLLLAYFSPEGVKSLKIQVLDGSTVKKNFYDSSAFFEDRSYMIPTHKNEGILGNLVYPVPRNACSTVEDAAGNRSIAFLYEFMDCPQSSAVNLRSANYIAILALTQDSSYNRDIGGDLPRAIITDLGTAQYLIHNVLENESHSEWELRIWDDSYANLEKLFVIFASTLLGAVVLAIAVFCTILCCRVLILRMRTRGLSRLQVRSLPKRKYRKMKETAESCSICLEEFKEGETVRVLPCQHVFHPSCVDVWLQKWNRTCPLCKSAIKKKKGLKASHPAPTTEDETSHLIPSEVAVPVGGGAYGATGYSGPTRDCRCHRRNASGASSSMGVASGRSSRRHTPQVTAASIELSWDSEDGRSTPTFHTPVQSDENITRSFATAKDNESIGVNNVAV